MSNESFISSWLVSGKGDSKGLKNVRFTKLLKREFSQKLKDDHSREGFLEYIYAINLLSACESATDNFCKVKPSDFLQAPVAYSSLRETNWPGFSKFSFLHINLLNVKCHIINVNNYSNTLGRKHHFYFEYATETIPSNSCTVSGPNWRTAMTCEVRYISPRFFQRFLRWFDFK